MTDMLDRNEIQRAADTVAQPESADKPDRTLLQSLDTKLIRCLYCSKAFWRRDRVCPECGTEVGKLTPPVGKTGPYLQRVYEGKDAERAFAKESSALARENWFISQVDRTAPQGPGFFKIIFLGLFAFMGKRQSRHINVTYFRGQTGIPVRQ